MGLERGVAWGHPQLAGRARATGPTKAGKSHGGAGAQHPQIGQGTDGRDDAGLYLKRETAISASASKPRNLNSFPGICGTCTLRCPDVKDSLN